MESCETNMVDARSRMTYPLYITKRIHIVQTQLDGPHVSTLVSTMFGPSLDLHPGFNKVST
jgi:hypothetical protein